MLYKDTEEFKLLCKKADSAIERAKGDIVATQFLNPKECYFLEEYLRYTSKLDRVVFFGGAKGAQRKKMFALPEYLTSLADGDDIIATARSYLGEDAFDICTLKVFGGGFRDFSHRDYLGGILALGLDRTAVGDIAPIDEFSAYVFLSRSAARFLTEGDFSDTGGIRIAHDRVRVEKVDLPSGYEITHKYKDITDTVASERLDCVVAALCNLSREAAKERILRGEVELNYECAEQISTPLCSGDLVSIRGVGKFLIASLTDPTKKGRIRLIAKKFI